MQIKIIIISMLAVWDTFDYIINARAICGKDYNNP